LFSGAFVSQATTARETAKSAPIDFNFSMVILRDGGYLHAPRHRISRKLWLAYPRHQLKKLTLVRPTSGI